MEQEQELIVLNADGNMLTNSITSDIKYYLQHGNMVIRLVLVNAGVFVFFGIFYLLSFMFQEISVYQWVVNKLEVPASLPLLLWQPWSLLTYMFLHTGFFHLLFNMLWLYWFGQIFMVYLSEKKILPLYIIGGLAGALVYILAYNLVPVFAPKVGVTLMLGASASVLAIVFAAASINPDHEVRLLLLGSVRIKYIALFSLLLDVINIPYGNAGGYLAHIGGAISGYFYIKSLRAGYDWATPFNAVFDWVAVTFSRKRKVHVSYRNTNYQKPSVNNETKNEQQRVDEILDKIARSGYDSLNKEEKDFLFHYSNKM